MDFCEVREYLNEKVKYETKYADEPRPQVLAKGYVTDREKSVAWNEDQVLFSIRQEKNWYTQRRNAEKKAQDAFRDDLIEAIMYDLGCSEAQAAVVYTEAYDRGHSYGYYEVLSDAESACEFIADYLSAAKGETHDEL